MHTSGQPANMPARCSLAAAAPAQVPWDVVTAGRAYATLITLAVQYWQPIRHHLRLRLINEALRSASGRQQQARRPVSAARGADGAPLMRRLCLPCSAHCPLPSVPGCHATRLKGHLMASWPDGLL
jgi:hypothetical protein